jgi:hypothetical protein
VLEPYEIQSMLSELENRFRIMVLLDVTTGERPVELFTLMWKHIDFCNLLIDIKRSIFNRVVGHCKNETSRPRVPVPPNVADLRHTFASWQMMIGGDLYELPKILGHSNIKMTERYYKLRANIARTGRKEWGILKLLEPICEAKSRVRCLRIVRARIFTRFLTVAKLLKVLVARDGIEPPTPAFSGPPTESQKWFEINGYH